MMTEQTPFKSYDLKAARIPQQHRSPPASNKSSFITSTKPISVLAQPTKGKNTSKSPASRNLGKGLKQKSV